MTYRRDKLAPTFLVVAIGGSTLAAMLLFLGGGIMTKWFFYPSAIFWLFSLRCLIAGTSKHWDRSFWRVCQWWSGAWSIVFLLFLCVPPFSSVFVGTIFAPIAIAGGINPFLAAFAHIMIWACITDILRDKGAESEEKEAGGERSELE